ncbi:MAG: hypothetical protein GY938_03995 [Ketobacter sp.]|nr:hypothetical protein [Ketobacter sp.]
MPTKKTKRETPKRTAVAQVEATDLILGEKRVLESPLSVVKMDISELRNFTNRIDDFLKDPGTAAIRLCECCINVD